MTKNIIPTTSRKHQILVLPSFKHTRKYLRVYKCTYICGGYVCFVGILENPERYIKKNKKKTTPERKKHE